MSGVQLQIWIKDLKQSERLNQATYISLWKAVIFSHGIKWVYDSHKR